MKLRPKHIIYMLVFAALVIGGGLLSTHVFAQGVDTGLNEAAQTGLGNVDPRVTIARIIQIALGFIGIIGVIIMLYAGWLWMSARGNEEKIDQAKKLLKRAAIGLGIIVSSFAIVTFILSRLVDTTAGGPGAGGVCSPACSAGQYCCNSVCQATPCSNLGGGEDIFAISGTVPAHEAVNVPRNAVIRFGFSKGVRENSVSASTFSVKKDTADVAGSRTVSGSVVEFVPDANCEAPNGDLKCFEKNSTYTVEAASGTSGIMSLDNKTLVCTGVYRCSIQFTTGEIIDTEAPRVNILTQQVCVSANNTLAASSIDNYGVSKIDFFANTNPAGTIVNNSNPFVGSPFEAQVSLDASGYGESLLFKATAYDIDSNEASAEKQIPISPAHCCNGLKDGDETGIDCGGSCVSCAALNAPRIAWVSPAGGFCTNDKNTSCRKQTEVQDCGTNATCDLGTPNGAAGNLVTIGGSGFGVARGKVFFPNGSGGRIEARLADDPSGNPACAGNVWQDGQVIAIVPAGAGEGPLVIETSAQLSDSTADGNGSLINDFKNNTIERPGICALTPGKGKLNDVIQYEGVKLSSSEAYYGNLSSNLKSPLSVFTNAQRGTATVPNLATGSTTTFVQKSAIESNFISFVKDSEPYSGPIISSVEPLAGPVGQYVTIRGSGFGATRAASKVYFGDTSGVEADYAFPDVCAQSMWTDKQIIVKVPQNVGSGGFKITVSVPSFSPVDSGSLLFQVTAGSPNPGICRIDPSLGQANSEVTLWGEYFQDNNELNSIVRFYNNRDQNGTAVSFWGLDQNASGIKPWKAVTTVPQQAATGPVRIVAGSPAQISNSLNFTVGQCRQDADCGSGATCCAAGLPEAGKCKASSAECYGSIATSVYEWQFSTGSDSTCGTGQVRCGTACCVAGSCENEAESQCAGCLPGQNKCEDGSCCNGDCQTPPGGGQSTCSDPTSCSGYSLNQCLDGYYCPNSPGLCSPYPGNGTTVTGECGDTVCDAKAGCENGACHYDQNLNRCVKDGSGDCSVKTVKNAANQIITINNQPVAATCRMFENNPRWHIDWNATCPSGWVIAPGGGRCVDTTSINGSCEVCGSGLSCLANGDTGICGAAQAVCADGSTCDPSDNKCKATTGASCDCCCDKNQNTPEGNPGCCAGLSCTDSCGAGGDLGVCSGCAPGGIPDDNLCNCTGTSGKFCQVTPEIPSGVCTDCASITNPAECSQHEQCCVDGKNRNACTSIRPDGSSFVENEVKYCAYYDCTNQTPNTCNPLAVKDGAYDRLNVCDANCTSAPITCGVNGSCDANSPCPENMRCDALSCECKADEPPPGEPCRDPETGNCSLTCMQGYQCLLPSINGGGGIGTDNTCRCCCKPPTGPGDVDTCKMIDEGLNCIANQGLCTSPSGERGACCGCSADSQCGDTLTTGCGLTDARCCQARPRVIDQSPTPNSNGVCRNPVIEAVFNQRMDISTFSDNVLVVGDYGTTSCPNGYPLVAAAPTDGSAFGSIARFFKRIAATVVPGLTAQPAFADVSNFCVVSGSPVGYDISSTQTKVSYQLTRALEPNIRYYVVIRGDGDLDSLGEGEEKDHYNTRITSIAKIGLLATNDGSRIPELFNHTAYPNSQIWTFTTGADVCQLDKVKVSPSFKLFQQTGQTETLTATAQDRSGQSLQPIPGYYGWTWDWSSDNDEVAKVEQSGQENQALATAGNKRDAQTVGKAKATITVDQLNQTVGESRQGTAQLRLFLCENPWPVYYAYPPFPSGYSWPWKDDTTGIEFYYCRDANGSGTNDDLPAIKDNPLVNTSGRKICMLGSNTGNTCTSDANCNNIAGSCLPEVLKEFFFFREFSPVPPTITGTVEAAGGSVTLSWSPVATAARYKIYYGTGPGRYTQSKTVEGNAPAPTVIGGLTNNVTYYFVVTALTDKNQEGSYSNELRLKPLDTLPPAVPTVQASAGDKKISLFWPRVSDAVRYIAYLGVQPRNGQNEYGINSPVINVPTNPNTPAIVFSNLNNEATYYLSVRSIDRYGNVSDYSTEIAKKPNEPYLVTATPGNASVILRWLPFVNAQGYTIYVGTETGKYDLENPITVAANATQHTVSGLANNTVYYFAIKARLSPSQESSLSNERNSTPGSNETGG